MVLHADGSVTVLAIGRPNLLLGIDPATRRTEADVELEPGATLLLYTDGLIERRGRGVHEGLDELRGALAGLTDQPLDALCDEVLARMLPPEPQDDVALVAVRLQRGDA
jgi:serine phosphatase RsbU (regulator of sigma subunit)